MEQKQIFELEGLKKPEYQVFEINGMKLDYFDFNIALIAVQEAIINYHKQLEVNPNIKSPRYDGMLHTLETKLQEILKKMDRPPEDEIRPAGLGVEILPDNDNLNI